MKWRNQMRLRLRLRNRQGEWNLNEEHEDSEGADLDPLDLYESDESDVEMSCATADIIGQPILNASLAPAPPVPVVQAVPVNPAPLGPNASGTALEEIAALREELLIFAHKWVQKGRSSKDLETTFELASLIYGNMAVPMFRCADVRRILSVIKEEFVDDHSVLCKTCGRKLLSQNSLCRNNVCSRRMSRIRRTKKNRKEVLDCANLRRILSVHVYTNIEELLRIHEDLHLTRANQPDCRKDCRFFPSTAAEFESWAEFQSRELCMPLTVGTDGFGDASIRGEMWPVTLQLLSYAPQQRLRRQNQLLVSIISTGKTVSDNAWTIVCGSIGQSIEELNRHPIEVRSTRGIIRVRFRLSFVSMDSAAVASLYALSGWAGYNGCPICTLRGTRVRGAMKWPLCQNCAKRVDSGGPHNVYVDSSTGSAGFKRTTPWMRLIPCTRILPDALHALQEGVLTDWITFAMFRKGPLIFRLTPRGHQRLLLAAASFYPSGSGRVFVPHVSELRRLRGSEKDNLFSGVLVPVLMGEDNVADVWVAALIIVFITALKTVQQKPLVAPDFTILRFLLSEWFACASYIFGDLYSTYKLHLLEHAVEYLETTGDMYELSTAASESVYSLFKMLIPRNSKRGQSTKIMECFIADSFLRHALTYRSLHGGQLSKDYMSSLCHVHLDRIMRQRQELTPGVFVSVSDVIRDPTPDIVQSVNYAAGLGFSIAVCYRRMAIRDFVYEASSSPDARRSETQRDWAVVVVNGTLFPTRIKVFFKDVPGRPFAVVEVFHYNNPLVRVANTLSALCAAPNVTNTHRRICTLLRRASTLNSHYFLLLPGRGSNEMCVPVSDIMGPASPLTSGNDLFIVNQTSKYFST